MNLRVSIADDKKDQILAALKELDASYDVLGPNLGDLWPAKLVWEEFSDHNGWGDGDRVPQNIDELGYTLAEALNAELPEGSSFKFVYLYVCTMHNEHRIELWDGEEYMEEWPEEVTPYIESACEKLGDLEICY